MVLVARIITLEPLENSFTKSLLGFNPFLHQPPPPCYPLYVAMGKFLNFFLHDALWSLLALNVIASLATYLFLARAYPLWIAVAAALIPMPTRPLPDLAAIACFAFALQAEKPVLRGIALAAVIGCVPQTIFVILLYMVIVERKAWLSFLAMLFVEFLQTVQNIELRRLRAFIAENIDLTRTFDPWAAKIVAVGVVAAVTYHLIRAKAVDLGGGADVQRGGEH